MQGTMKRLTLLALFICSGMNVCVCVEELAPERLLLPRNFNPHPYQVGENARGPVLFPAEPAAATNDVNNHPYAKVVEKQKLLNGIQEQNQINPQVYNALARHAQKVLHKPQYYHQANAEVIHPQIAVNTIEDPTYSDQKKDYAFSYIVQDQKTGDDFSHSQSQDSRSTSGEYRVKLPDGRLQIVSYSADKNGYQADVKYSADGPNVGGAAGVQDSGEYVEYNTPFYVPSLHYNGAVGHFSHGTNKQHADDLSVYHNSAGRAEIRHHNFIPITEKYPEIYPNIHQTQSATVFPPQINHDSHYHHVPIAHHKELTKTSKPLIQHQQGDVERYSQVYFTTPNQHVHHEQNHGYY